MDYKASIIHGSDGVHVSCMATGMCTLIKRIATQDPPSVAYDRLMPANGPEAERAVLEWLEKVVGGNVLAQKGGAMVPIGPVPFWCTYEDQQLF